MSSTGACSSTRFNGSRRRRHHPGRQPRHRLTHFGGRGGWGDGAAAHRQRSHPQPGPILTDLLPHPTPGPARPVGRDVRAAAPSPNAATSTTCSPGRTAGSPTSPTASPNAGAATSTTTANAGETGSNPTAPTPSPSPTAPNDTTAAATTTASSPSPRWPPPPERPAPPATTLTAEPRWTPWDEPDVIDLTRELIQSPHHQRRRPPPHRTPPRPTRPPPRRTRTSRLNPGRAQSRSPMTPPTAMIQATARAAADTGVLDGQVPPWDQPVVLVRHQVGPLQPKPLEVGPEPGDEFEEVVQRRQKDHAQWISAPHSEPRHQLERQVQEVEEDEVPGREQQAGEEQDPHGIGEEHEDPVAPLE